MTESASQKESNCRLWPGVAFFVCVIKSVSYKNIYKIIKYTLTDEVLRDTIYLKATSILKGGT
jgi:hypothetical protein